MVITRFAPSPTGDLHIGGVRTALFSWLHARQHQGVFRLRIEDTDRERSTEASTQVILDGMRWLGLNADGDIVRQSQRFDLYNQVIEDMIAKGLAYYCWCSPEELEAMREAQKARGEKPRYNGKYRNGGEPVAGVQPVVRFKNPLDGSVSWDDQVRGKITIQNNELDDFIIRRSDGTPTYNFCVVIDDAEQQVSMVIRGEDHISNTPRQINLYQALGYAVPTFAHVPMILGDDGQRLSKRHGATNVLDYRSEGYLPEAIVNYLVRLGWSHGDQEIFSLEELMQYFRINQVNSAPSAFNTEKLRWLNQHYLQQADSARLQALLPDYLQAQGYDLAAHTLAAAIPHYLERAKTLKEMAEHMCWIAVDPQEYPMEAQKKAFKDEQTGERLTYLAEKLAALGDFDEHSVHTAIEETVAHFDIGFGKIGQPARLALTGGASSPDLAVSFVLAGKEAAVRRLQAAVDYLKKSKYKQISWTQSGKKIDT